MISLRAPEPEDLELFYTIENDRALWVCSSPRTHVSRYAIKRYIAEASHDIFQTGELRLVVVECESGQAIGMVDFTSHSAMDGRAEVSVVLLASRRGKGLGRQALQQAMDYARSYLRIRMLYALVSETRNAASRQLFEQAGFAAVAVLPAWHNTGDSYDNIVVYQKLL